MVNVYRKAFVEAWRINITKPDESPEQALRRARPRTATRYCLASFGRSA
jgi:hypothetical protein